MTHQNASQPLVNLWAPEEVERVCREIRGLASALAAQMITGCTADALRAYQRERSAGRLRTQIVVDIECGEITMQLAHKDWKEPRFITRLRRPPGG